MQISYTSYIDAITAFEAIRRLLDPEMALTDQQLAEITVPSASSYELLAPVQHAVYRRIHEAIEAEWVAANPTGRLWNPFVTSRWRGETHTKLTIYTVRDRLTHLVLSCEGGVFVLEVKRVAGEQYGMPRPFDVQNPAHRRVCAILVTTVTEFNQVEGLIDAEDLCANPVLA